MKFINNTDELIYISKLTLFIPVKGVIEIEKHIGFENNLVPYKAKLRKKYNKKKV